MEIIMAIDPGWSGGVAVDLCGRTVIHNCPETQKDIVDIVKEFKSLANINEWKCKCVIEKVHSMPGQGVCSVWKFSANYATWQTALLCCGIEFTEVSPQKWMKVLGGCPKDKKERKNYIKDKMQKLNPELKVTLKTADALALLSVSRKLL